MSEFPLFWRFDESARAAIQPNSPKESEQLWDRWVSPTYKHLMSIPAGWNERWLEVERVNVDTDKPLPNQVASWVEPNLLLFFWSRVHSARLPAASFLQHWSDFCYPDDDNTAILLDNSRLLVFCEETFTLYRAAP